MLGHKIDMPGSGQWRVYTNVDELKSHTSVKHGTQNDCWVCDH